MRLTFHGAVRGVTGSCHRVTLKDAEGKQRQLLVDCGLYQGERMGDSKNFEPFGFEPKKIDAVMITHAHADHIGRLPVLAREGYAGPIFATPPTASLMRIVLEDAFQVMTENAERCGDEVLYERQDLDAALDLIERRTYHEDFEPVPGVTVRFHDAGHILGSAYVTLDEGDKRLVVSGDIGNDEVPILPDTEPISRATAVVTESTYGNREHESVEERSRALREEIEAVIRDKSVLMIPAFSIERTQELLYELNNLLLHDLKTDIPIYLDSPMAIHATETYQQFKTYLRFDAPILSDPDRDFFSFPNLRVTLERKASKAINAQRGPMVIIAGSGMMSGGRIMHHLLHRLGHKKNRVLIIGYQAHGTLGRKIYEGAKEVEIFREKVKVNAHIRAIGSFSAHGDKNKLTRWLTPEDGQVPRIFLVHGDPDAKEMFATHLRHHLKAEVEIPAFEETFEV